MANRNPWKMVAACLAAGGVYLWFAPRPAAAPELVFAPVTSDPGVTTSPAISLDGQLAAYASDRADRNLDLYVQPLPRGTPVRLTSTVENESEPAISPDSGTIAFRSEKSGGALFVIPSRGGEARLLAPGGHDPRYSPDGKWIAYWDQAASFVIPSSGGTPRRVFPELTAVRHPIWSPDGSLLMAKSDDDYVTGSAGGRAAGTGISARLNRQPSDSASWTSAGLFLVVRSGWVRNIWRVPLDARGRSSGAPVRITQGAESTGDLAVSRDGRMIFANGSQRFNVWGIPLDANSGKATGAPYRITEGPAVTENPAISADGRRLLYDAQRNGGQQVFVRDLDTGAERAVAGGPRGATGGRWLPGGGIAYRVRTQSGADAYALDAATGEARKLASGATIADCSGETALLESAGAIDALNLKTLTRTPFLRPAASQPAFAPDGRSVAFVSGARIYTAPAHGVQEIPQAEWKPVANGAKPRFSPDGRLIYFVRDAGVYGVRADATGAPFAVWESHDPRLSLESVNPAALELGIARDKLVLLLAESSFNLWMADSR